MYDIFVIFSMKEFKFQEHLDHDDFDDFHEFDRHDDDDHDDEDDHEDDDDDHGDDDDDHDRRRRRLQIKNSEILRKKSLLNIEKIHNEIKSNEYWNQLCLADRYRNHQCSPRSIMSPIEVFQYRNGTSALPLLTQKQINYNLDLLIKKLK